MSPGPRYYLPYTTRLWSIDERVEKFLFLYVLYYSLSIHYIYTCSQTLAIKKTVREPLFLFIDLVDHYFR